jgi:hypothetical protein
MFVSENVSCRKNATKKHDAAELAILVGDVSNNKGKSCG